MAPAETECGMKGYLTGPANTALLDRLVKQNAKTDAEIAAEEARLRRERNDEIYQAAIRRWFGIETR